MEKPKISAEDAKEMANKVKDTANKAKNTAKEKLEQIKNMSSEERKAYAKQKTDELKNMPKDKKIKYGAIGAAALFALYLITSGPSSPEGKAQAACEAMKDGDFEEAASYVPEKYRKQALGMMMTFAGSEKSLKKMSNYDCSIKEVKQGKKEGRLTVYFEKAPKIKMGQLDGEWYVKF